MRQGSSTSATNAGSFSTPPTVIVHIMGPGGIVQWSVTPHSCQSATGRSCTTTTSSLMTVFAAPVSTTSGNGRPSTSLSVTPVRPSHCCFTATRSSLTSSVMSWHTNAALYSCLISILACLIILLVSCFISLDILTIHTVITANKFFHSGSLPSGISLPFTSESAIVHLYPATSLVRPYPTPDTNCYKLLPTQQGHPHPVTTGQGRAASNTASVTHSVADQDSIQDRGSTGITLTRVCD
ncbi:hypothetical protein E2C01_058167 [Portunus trituberculatus]|uniref:Uncharacterized protein n=1 Tax=Portunus trituberculatus TaxID=210409 RepID=A0A5B7H4K3_PORTR|nr:hypothetical protein [Portunus trituberculatus]